MYPYLICVCCVPQSQICDLCFVTAQMWREVHCLRSLVHSNPFNKSQEVFYKYKDSYLRSDRSSHLCLIANIFDSQ